MKKFKGITAAITAELKRILGDPVNREENLKPIREKTKALLISDKQGLSLTIKKSKFTKIHVQVIVGENETKEEEEMFHNVMRRANSMMCCRMLRSRANTMAGVRGCLAMRLEHTR